MKSRSHLIRFGSMLLLSSALLIGCQTTAAPPASDSSNQQAAPPATGDEQAAATRPYTDYVGHTVQIPVAPRHIIFAGETYGDLLALDVHPIGTVKMMLQGLIFENQEADVKNIGWPIESEPIKSTEALMKNPVWLSLPAVKAGHVYTIPIQQAASDAYTQWTKNRAFLYKSDVRTFGCTSHWLHLLGQKKKASPRRGDANSLICIF